MNLKNLIVLCVLTLVSFNGFADDQTCCLEGRTASPCDGEPGTCTVNKDGSCGGFVAFSANVAQSPNSWTGYFLAGSKFSNQPYISATASVCELATVSESAEILDHARIFGQAEVRGSARVSDQAQVFDSSLIMGESWVHGNALIYGQAVVSEQALVFENAQIYDSASVYGRAHIRGSAEVYGASFVYESAYLSGHARVRDLIVKGHTRIDTRDVAPSSGEQHSSERLGPSPEALESVGKKLIEIEKTKLETIRPELNELDEKEKILRGRIEDLKSQRDEKLETLKLDHCPICYEPLLKKNKLKVTRCKHVLCNECLQDLRKDSCPLCREEGIKQDAVSVDVSGGL